MSSCENVLSPALGTGQRAALYRCWSMRLARKPAMCTRFKFVSICVMACMSAGWAARCADWYILIEFVSEKKLVLSTSLVKEARPWG